MAGEHLPAIGVLQMLRTHLERAGLLPLGVVALGEEAAYPAFRRWLQEGKQASMHYLENHQAVRQDPRALLPGARSAVIFAWNYNQGDRHVAGDMPRKPRLAQYARLKDYHVFLRKTGEAALQAAQAYYRAATGTSFAGRVVTDSAPVLERSLAARTAEGFVGKNTCYIHPRHGSWLLLGEIVLDLDIPTDQPAAVDSAVRSAEGGCGTCRRCQVNCPTGALEEAYRLDANRCLSYWTIEHRGTIPEVFWPWLPYYFYGCDICQLVCPYNRQAPLTSRDDLVKIRETPAMRDVAMMTQADYEQWFGGTPATRAKRSGLRRNALIVLAVTGDGYLDEALAHVGAEDEAVLQATAQQIRAWVATRPPRKEG